jgi:hypothetical protein
MLELFPPVIHGTLREHYLLLFGAAGTFGLMTGLLGAWIGAYFGGRRGARKAIQQMEAQPAQLLEANIAELRHGMESVALEMERIAEGQRFTARMLMERVGPLAPAQHRRDGTNITPH